MGRWKDFIVSRSGTPSTVPVISESDDGNVVLEGFHGSIENDETQRLSPMVRSVTSNTVRHVFFLLVTVIENVLTTEPKLR